jgi:Domain of unknown function (DUF4062)
VGGIWPGSDVVFNGSALPSTSILLDSTSTQPIADDGPRRSQGLDLSGVVRETGPHREASRPHHRARRFTRVVRIFVSSPGDLAAERELVATTITQLGEIPAMAERFTLRPVRWERETPPVVGMTPELVIERFVGEMGESDIFLMLMYNRLGSPFVHPVPGQGYASGTEYELGEAYRCYRHSGRPVILAYRCTRPPPEPVDLSEKAAVDAFFASFNERFEGIKPREFIDERGLQALLFRDLGTVIEAIDRRRSLLKRVLIVATALLALVGGWFVNNKYQSWKTQRLVNEVVTTALADGAAASDPSVIWERAGDRLLALGPHAVAPVFDWLGVPAVYAGFDQSPTEAFVRVLALAAQSGQAGVVCDDFWDVLAQGRPAPRYPKSTHRLVIAEGFPAAKCPVEPDRLCTYLSHLRPEDFTDGPQDLLDLRDAATPTLHERASFCFDQGHGKAHGP